MENPQGSADALIWAGRRGRGAEDMDKASTSAQADSTSQPAPTVTFVTVSYGPDRDRCALMCRSIDALAPPTCDHLIIVDRTDLPKFRDLESRRRRIVATEDVLPKRVWRLEARRVGFRSNVFLQMGRPIRGWLVQQLVKLAACREVATDVILHTDSDVALVRRFDGDLLFDAESRLRLYSAPGAIEAGMPHHVRWHRIAEHLLGLDATPLPLPDYITSLVPWARENGVALLEFLERRYRRSWMRTISSSWNFSEYVLYGRFVSDVLGETAGQFTTPSSLCRDYWDREPLSEAQIESLIDGMRDDQVALSITAKAGIKPESYVSVLERHWALAQATTDNLQAPRRR
jgi:hypothetical protein